VRAGGRARGGAGQAVGTKMGGRLFVVPLSTGLKIFRPPILLRFALGPLAHREVRALVRFLTVKLVPSWQRDEVRRAAKWRVRKFTDRG